MHANAIITWTVVVLGVIPVIGKNPCSRSAGCSAAKSGRLGELVREPP